MAIELLVEWSVLAAAAISPLRLCAKKNFWRMFPNYGYLLVGALTAYVVVVTALTIYAPTYLRPLAGIIGVALIIVLWRGRAGYGKRRGLVPGSLALRPSLDSLFDHRFYEKQHHKHGPMFKISQFYRPMVCVTDLSRGLELIRQNDLSLGPPLLIFDRFIPEGFIRNMSSDDHQVYRKILKTLLSMDVVHNSEHRISSSFASGIDHMAQESRCTVGGIHPAKYLDDILYDVFLRIFFGVESDTERGQRLRELYTSLYAYGLAFYGQEVRTAVEEITEIVRSQINELAHASPDESNPACFLDRLLKLYPEMSDDLTIIQNLIYVNRITRSDVGGLLNWIFKLLSDNPKWAQRLGEEPLARDEGSWRQPETLAGRIVAETLRLEQSEYLCRKVLEDIHWQGFWIPKGWLVRVCPRDAHQNEAVFENPRAFNPDRFLGRHYGTSEYAPFGIGRHSCLGAQFAVTIGRIFVNELGRHWKWTVVCDGPRELNSHHWNHWRPSPNFRVSFSPLSA
ncbi:MAG: cytochrome P450 [Gammaproteobacteria bacterium]|nr:cytochrome P450 [Gammaproteobacteria bacterium]